MLRMKWISKRKLSQFITKGESRISKNSIFYGKAVPAMLIGMVIVTLVLILIATGILIGFLPFQ